jgi:hypothetical protein
MRRHINVKKSATCVLNDYKHIEHTKGGCDRDTEVTRHDAFCLVAEKRGPALREIAFAGTSHTIAWHIFTYGSWRDPQAELEQEFVGNALLPPGRILQGHAANQCPQVHGQSGSSGLGFPAPKQAKTLTMPTDEGLGSYNT